MSVLTVGADHFHMLTDIFEPSHECLLCLWPETNTNSPWLHQDVTIMIQRLSNRPKVEPAVSAKGCYANEKRSEEHTSELQSLMRISYAVICLKNKKKNIIQHK